MGVEIVSIHVPKTAGTSFRCVLEGVYGEDAVFHDNGRYYGRTLAEMPLEPRHRAIHGHVWAGRYRRILPACRRVTWLRHPVNWLISLHGFLNAHALRENPAWNYLEQERPSLLEFAASAAVHAQAPSRFLRDVPLDDFFFVGLQEHFADDLRDLGAMMNWRTSTLPTVNVNPSATQRRVEVWSDRSLVEGICDRLEQDMKLYEDAQCRRDRRLCRAIAS